MNKRYPVPTVPYLPICILRYNLGELGMCIKEQAMNGSN